MGIFSERALAEVNAKVVTTLGLDTEAIVTKATKFVRFDWRELLSYFENLGLGTTPPWVIIRPGPEEETNWDMASHTAIVPIEIFLVESEVNRVKTTVSNGINSVTQTVGSTTKMFVGQRLWFATAQSFAIVLTVDSSTQITLETAVNTISGETILSEIQSDVHVKMEKLRRAFSAANTFTYFQILEDTVIDVSDMNPVNESVEKDNYILFAGSCYAKLVVGETL
jgi:hypothetical protein